MKSTTKQLVEGLAAETNNENQRNDNISKTFKATAAPRKITSAFSKLIQSQTFSSTPINSVKPLTKSAAITKPIKTARKDPFAKPGNSQKRIRSSLPLSDEQNLILNKITSEKTSLFFTGFAGSGKSYLLRAIIDRLSTSMPNDQYAVTASTGLAAHNIQGVSLHSFAGIGLGKGKLDALVTMCRKNLKTLHRWKSVKIIIIDEGIREI
jgi:ATP-dependent DNA helicase PIF1